MGILIFAFVLLVGLNKPAEAAIQNQTVECSFREVNKCFKLIPTLGGNFSVKYAEKNSEMNQSCTSYRAFSTCLNTVPTQCHAKKSTSVINSIVNFVGKLCKNGTVEQKNFMNSSNCYNKNQSRRERCVKKNSTSKNDAKSLCCQSKKTQTCLKSDLLRMCSRNATDFQNNLIDTYSSFTNMLCTPYTKYCGGAANNFLSFACLILALKVALWNWD